MSGVAAASKEASELSFKLGQDQLAWAKDQFAQNKGVSDKVVDSLLNSQKQSQDQANEYYQRYKDTFQPAQDRYLQDAEAYDTPGRRDQVVGAAQAQVGEQFAAARDSATRQLESFGVNPASTRFAALDAGTRAKEAATKAAAGNQAALQNEATGLALRTNAINMGNGLPGQSTAAYGTSTGAGQGAVNSGNATTATGSSAMTAPSAYTGQGIGAIGQWGNTINQGYQNQLSQFKADQSASSGWGSALGALAGLGMTAMGVPGGGAIGGGLGSMFGGGGGSGQITLGGSGGPMPFYAEGGAVDPQATPGGAIPMGASPSQGRAVDDVPAQLTAGEFVIPKDVVSWEGEKSLQNLIMKARKAKEGAGAKPAIGNGPAGPPAVQSRPAIGAAA